MKQQIILEGIISVRAALVAQSRKIECIYANKAKQNKEVLELKRLAQKYAVPFTWADADFVQASAHGHTHGGIIAFVQQRQYANISDIVSDSACEFIVAFEGIEDPFNLGHSIRSLYASGANAVLLPDRELYGADSVIIKASAGTSELMPTALLRDYDEVVRTIKQAGFTIACAEKSSVSVSLYDIKLQKPLLLVIGGEKRGISKAFRANADIFIEIPYARSFTHALTTTSAASIMAFEIMRRIKQV